MKDYTTNESLQKNNPDNNPDPITGTPGAHPVGTGLGAASAGAAGAAIGAVGGPVGITVGAIVGAVAGGLAGKGVAEAVNPTAEEAYWRNFYKTRPYVDSRVDYDEYGPAYRYGWEARTRYGSRQFDDVESELERDWSRARGKSSLDWSHARHATRDAWEHIDNSYPGENRP
jgi:hypothetical protein